MSQREVKKMKKKMENKQELIEQITIDEAGIVNTNKKKGRRILKKQLAKSTSNKRGIFK